MLFLKEFFEKVDFEINQQTTKMHEILASMQRVKTQARDYLFPQILQVNIPEWIIATIKGNLLLEMKSLFFQFTKWLLNPYTPSALFMGHMQTV